MLQKTKHNARDRLKQWPTVLPGHFAGEQGKYMQIAKVGDVVGSDDMLDTLHANRTGNTKMARVWHEAIRQTYPTLFTP